MHSKTFETSREAWNFIKNQPGRSMVWTYEKVDGGWRARQMTSDERAEANQIFGDLYDAFEDSKTTIARL